MLTKQYDVQSKQLEVLAAERRYTGPYPLNRPPAGGVVARVPIRSLWHLVVGWKKKKKK